MDEGQRISWLMGCTTWHTSLRGRHLWIPGVKARSDVLAFGFASI